MFSVYRYAHALCDRVPSELIDALVEKDLFICKTCRRTKLQKKGCKYNVCSNFSFFYVIVMFFMLLIRASLGLLRYTEAALQRCS